MIWNHDYTPTFDNNPCLKSLAWLEVASAVSNDNHKYNFYYYILLHYVLFPIILFLALITNIIS